MFETVTDRAVAQAPVCLGDAAFLFADIVGFTAFTEAHGDAHAAELAWRLRLGVERQLGADAHVVKTLGDAVMVRIADPAEAAAAGLRILERALPGPLDPPVRVGIACGSAVERDGDFFGATVNLAARVAALAGAGEVLVSDQVAQIARTRMRSVELEQRGAKWLRNISQPVVLHAVRPRVQTASGRRLGGHRAAARTLYSNLKGTDHVYA
jgi:adenylate cyclase